MVNWIYEIDRKIYIADPLLCKYLAFRLDDSPVLFRPERLLSAGLTYPSFLSHARFLAQYFEASKVTVVEERGQKNVVFFRRKKWIPNTERKEGESLQDFYYVEFKRNYIENNVIHHQPIEEYLVSPKTTTAIKTQTNVLQQGDENINIKF